MRDDYCLIREHSARERFGSGCAASQPGGHAAERCARDDARQAAIVAEGIRQAAASSPGVAFQPGTRTIDLTDEEYAQIKGVLDRERADGSVRPRFSSHEPVRDPRS